MINVYSNYDYSQIREIAHLVKKNNRDGIYLGAEIIESALSPIRGDVVLVPIPNRNGNAVYTRGVADIISKRNGVEMIDCLKSQPHISLYDQKLKYGFNNINLIKCYTTISIPESKTIVLIDNVLDTGTTAVSSAKAFNRDVCLGVLGHTQNSMFEMLKFN